MKSKELIFYIARHLTHSSQYFVHSAEADENCMLAIIVLLCAHQCIELAAEPEVQPAAQFRRAEKLNLSASQF